MSVDLRGSRPRTRSRLQSLTVVLVLVLPPLLFGAALAWFWALRVRWLFAGLCLAGLAIGAISGTTPTHAFDILWWWKGASVALLLSLGALGMSLFKKGTGKGSAVRW